MTALFYICIVINFCLNIYWFLIVLFVCFCLDSCLSGVLVAVLDNPGSCQVNIAQMSHTPEPSISLFFFESRIVMFDLF